MNVSQSLPQALSIRNGWIFSKTADLLVFGTPVLVGGLITLGFEYFYLRNGKTGSLIQLEYSFFLGLFLHWILTTCIDVPHAFSTFVRIGFDRENLKRNALLYTVVPVTAFLFIGVSANISNQVAFRMIAYLNIFHSIRQEYGWVMYSRKIAKEIDSVGKKLDTLMVYNLGIFPVLWLHCHRAPNSVWLFPGDLYNILPESLGDTAQLIYWSIIGIYFCSIGLRILQKKALNLAKLYLFLMIWISWYIGIVLCHGTTWMVDLAHAIPYLYLIAQYGYRRWNHETGKLRSFVFKNNRIFFFYFPLVALAILKSKAPLNQDNPWIFSLFFLPAVTHYILDGFIWKTRNEGSFLILSEK